MTRGVSSFHLNRICADIEGASGHHSRRSWRRGCAAAAAKWVSAFCLIAATAAACGQTATEQVIGPAGVRCQVTLSSPAAVPAPASAFTLPLVTARDCAWSIAVDGNWLTVEPQSGQGEAVLSVAATENPQGRTRIASLAINDQKFAITQEAAPCHFAVDPTSIAMPAEGGRALLQLTTLEGCSWTTQTSPPWARVVSGSGGDSSRDIEVAVDSNPGDHRSGELRIADIPVTISQDSISNSERGCPYSVGLGAATFGAAGGNGSVRLHTRPDCAWGASSSESWLVIVSNTNFIGTDDIKYRVDPNPSSRSRTGTITAGPRRHIVRQAGQ
jgi:hypothetical protein